MTQKDTPFQQPQAPLSPLSKPPRRSRRPIVFLLPIIGLLILLAGGGILLWQFTHATQSSQSSKPTSAQGSSPNSGQATASTGCASRLPFDWIAQQLPPQIHLTETQVSTQVHAGKSVQAIAVAQGVSAQQLYQLESQILHNANVRWHQQGCASQSDYNDNEQRAKAMTPVQMDSFFTGLYTS